MEDKVQLPRLYYSWPSAKAFHADDASLDLLSYVLAGVAGLLCAAGLAAPALDLVLYAGDRVSRVVARNELPPDPVRRSGLPPATRD